MLIRQLLSEADDRAGKSIFYHLTAKPRFKLDPKVAPAENYLSWDYVEGAGLYVTDQPEYWWNGKGYIRPFIAEIWVGFDMEPYRARFGHEWRIPAEKFPECKITRVIPTDEWFGEEYGATYTTEEKRPPGYRSSDDVRSWPMDRARAVTRDLQKWRKAVGR